MKSFPNRTIEVLESRIAPARIIIAGIPNSLNQPDSDFTDSDLNAPFVNTEANSLDPISAAVGGGLPGVADTFYLRLSAGDKLQLFRTSAGSSVEDFLIVQSGNIVVFFIDKEDSNGVRNNEVNEADIVGISAGNGAQFELKGALPGDIVYNLNEQGTPSLADDTLVMTGPMIPGVNVKGFTVGSSVGGSVLVAGVPELVGGKVLASGKINNVIVSGNVGTILAGSAGNGETFDFFPKYIGAGAAVVDTPGGNGIFSFVPAPGKAGSMVQKVLVDSVTTRIEAGVGGEGAAGGSISNVIIRADSDGFTIKAGDGGTTSVAKPNGGKGGSVSNVIVAGATDFTANDLVEISAGLGGNSLTGVGGAGGTVSKAFVGYTVLNGKVILSSGILRDNVLVTGGQGGDGKIGGKGGAVTTLDILTSTPESTGDEIAVLGGQGGASIVPAGGKSGAGGSVTSSFIRNVEASIGSDIAVRGGDAGSSFGLGVGAVGGSVTSVALLGRQIQIEAGDGSDGKVGGKGGDLSNLTVEERDGVVSDALVFNAGSGGDGNGGNAGKGGNISTVAIANSDVNVLEINGGVKANGGDSVNGRGGAGGTVTGVVILDSDANGTRGALNLMNIRTGAGGDGGKGGGNGGLLTNFSIVGVNIEPTIQTGEGGAATLNGKGGSGGSIKSLEVAITGEVKKLVGGVPTDVSASTFVSAGFGGDGAGISGGGGIGGSVSSASINTPGFGSVIAGDGGSGLGARATAGRGGNIVSAGVFAGEGEGELIAGDAGAVGVRPAAGGSISGTAAQPSGLFAERSLTIRAGDGASGGAGGSISFLGYGSTAATLVPTPNGNILVRAGDGSASPDGKSVGKGGSISTVSGAVNIGLGDTVIRAGDGGGASKKGAAGGSITNLSLQRGGELGVDFTVRAGDGGDSPLASTGAKGGSVSVVNIVEISTDAILRHIAGGDGGDALKVGGAGGSVSKVNVLEHDIGVRDGEVYGFNTMGGIFAGAGGAGAKEGATGSVSVINADAIATIAAGRGATPKLVTKVDNIYVNAGNLLKDSTHAFLESIPGSQQVYEFGGLSISATETTPGSGVSGEVQTVDIGSVRALPAGTQFTLSFQGEKTAALDKDATSVEIAAALNALGTVQATGPGNTGTVTISGADPVFDITFVQNGDQTVLIMGAVDSQKTAPLALTATPAEVDAALDALPFINAVGGVTVTASLPSGYQITFNNPSDQPQVIGQEVFAIASTDIQAGVGNNNSLVPVTEKVDATNEVHAFLPIAPFKFSITYTEGAVTSSTVQLAATATADEVQLALEALPTIDPGDISVAPAAPNGTFDVRFLDTVDHPTLQVTLFAEPLTVTEAQPGAFEYIAKEKQIIHVDPMGGGVVTFAFGLDSFQLNLATGFTVTQLSNQLNLQPSIIAQGGVTLTETPANSKNFQVEFGKAGDQPSIRVQEDAFPLGYTEVLLQGSAGAKETLLFTHQTGSQVRFGYQNAVTSFITPNAVGVFTAAAIDTALETLPGIGLNGVAVLADADNSFKITFSANGDRTDLNVGQRTTVGGVTIPRGVATTIQEGNATTDERQLIRTDDTGAFAISFGGAASAFLSAGAPATDVQAALDVILQGAKTVTVTDGVLPNSYIVEFNELATQQQILVEGINIEQTVDEALKGSNTLNQFEVQVVDYDGSGEFALHVPVGVTAQELRKGGDLTFETQLLGLAGVRALSGGEFTLTFQGQTTTPLASNATASQIQSALNALPNVVTAGVVTVTEQAGDVLNIQFSRVGDKTGVITGAVKGGVSTPLLPGNSTLSDISTALNNLAPITAVGGVTVVQPNAGSFNVVFNNPGQMPTLQALYQVREIQEIDFYQAGTFTISFGADPADVTQSIPAGASPADVEAAVNAIPGVQTAGGVTVSNGLNSRYEIQFNSAGDLPTFAGVQTLLFANSTLTEGTSVIQEVQKVVKPRRFVFDPLHITGGFTPAGVEVPAANYVGAFSDASEINGRIFKWVDADSDGIYDFNEVPLDGLIAAKVFNQATVNFTPEARIVGGEFSFTESVKGTSTDVEVQLLTIKSDRYTLSFGGLQTVPIPGNATILAIQKALNALPTIQATGPGGLNGSVTVTADATPNTFAVTFNTPGDRPPIIAPFFYDYNNIF